MEVNKKTNRSHRPFYSLEGGKICVTKKIAASCLATVMAVNTIFAVGPSVSVKAEESGSINLEDGLIGYYSFNNTLENAVGSGSATLHGGAGDTWNSATTGSAAYAQGKNGQAYSFTGDVSNVRGEGLQLDVSTSSDFTISLWVNTSQKLNFQPIVFTVKDNDNYLTAGTQYNDFASGGIANYKTKWHWLDKNNNSSSTLKDIPINEWVYVTLTMTDSGVATLYYNGEVLSTQTIADYESGYYANLPIFLGINWWDASFMGLMDDVSVYSKALSATEVSTLYANNGIPKGEVSEIIMPTHVSVHDPSIIKDPNTDMYYVFGSHRAWAKSSDLIHWELFENNLSRKENFDSIFANEIAWASMGDSTYTVDGNMWAPDVIWNEQLQKWCMYMSINGCSWNSCICLLTADSLDGDWEYVGPVIYSGFTESSFSHDYSHTDYEKVTKDTALNSRYIMSAYTCTGCDGKTKTSATTWNRRYGAHAIDPCIVTDNAGNWYMSYGSWSGGIYMIELDESSGLRDYNVVYNYVENETDPYMGYHLAGGSGVSGEASYIQKMGDYYYMYVTLGGLVATGGYNMRVFRSENITGPYVDYSGDDARSQTANYNSSVGNRVMSGYQWSYMSKGYVAQGHNSVMVDKDNRMYLFNHYRFNDGTESHEMRVHQIFINEDGWLVTAPFEYTGETLTNEVTKDDVAGAYEVLFHKLNIDYAGLEVVTGENLTFNADGTVSGDRTGTWKFSDKGAPYVTMTLGSTTYKGVFVQQQMEDSTDTTWCITLLGSDEISVWGYKYVGDGKELAEKAAENLSMPQGTFVNLTLPDKGINASTITWSSSNEAVLASDGTVTIPEQDTVVTLTATFTVQGVSVTKEYPITVYSPQTNTENKILKRYFTDEKVDLTNAVKGTYQYANPFYNETTKGLQMYNGVSIKFDVEATAGADQWLTDIIGFNSGNKGGLYFEGNSYLGFNHGERKIFDANVVNGTNWAWGTNFLQDSASVEIKVLPTGFEVYVNNTLAYTQADIGNKVPGSTDMALWSSILDFLQNAANYLNFGWGSWWEGGYKGTISNVVLSALPIEVIDTTGYLYYENFNRLAGKTGSDTGWVSPNASDKLSIISASDAHGYYLSYANPAASGNRGAYTVFPKEANVSKNFMVEADIILNSGNDNATVFAITDTSHTSKNGNKDISEGYFLKLTVEKNSTTCTVAGTDYTFKLSKDTWLHVRVSVDEEGNVTAKVGDKELTGTSKAANALGGMFLLNARAGSYSAVDNITIHIHDWDDGKVTKAPDCTISGEKTYTCIVCKDIKTEEIAATGHAWDDGKVTTQPTCEGKGVKTYTCINCKETKTEEIAATGHTELEPAQENRIEATCTKEGSYDIVVRCSVCNEILSTEHKIIPFTGHAWDDGKVTTQPTCEGKGVKTYTCINCKETKTEEIAATGHTELEPAQENRIEATCTKEGSYDIVVRCSVCNEILSTEHKIIPLAEHTWDDGKVTTQPTCEGKGEKTYTCINCKETRTEEIAATGHTELEPAQENRIEATCTKEGSYDIVVRCSVCNEILSTEHEIIPLAEHTWDDGKVTIEPTCEGKGEKIYTCIVCKEIRVETIEPLGHIANDGGTVTKEPTCTEAGILDFTCTRCHKGATEPIPALGHDWSEWSIDKEATCTEDGKRSRTCKRIGCNEIDEEIITAFGHTNAEAVREKEVAVTCETEGSYDEVVYCSVCKEEVSRESKTIPALGHIWSEWSITVPANCTEEGEESRTCTRVGCDGVEKKKIAALGHTAGEAVKENEIAATCETAGSYDEVVYCSVCKKEMSREGKTVPALGHTWSQWNISVLPNCTETGEKIRTCTRCKKIEKEAIAALGHTAGETVREKEIAATCETEGSYDEVVYCSVCKAELSRSSKTTPALGHTASEAVKEKEIAATCETEGSYDEVVYCSVCKEELSRSSKTTPALGHNWGEWNITVPAGCIEEGERSRACTRCDKVERESIVALGHTAGEAVREKEVTATCETEGSYDEVVYCSVCKEELSRSSKTTPALGHDWGEWNITVPAGCIEEGERSRACTRCDKVERESIAVLGHTAGEAVREKEVAPTCETEGSYDEVIYCSICKEELERQTKPVPALGHDWTQEGIITKNPTCMEKGEKTYTCSRCDKSRTEEIPATGHSYKEPEFIWSGDDSVTAKFICTLCDEINAVKAEIEVSTKNGIVTHLAFVKFEDKVYTDTKQVIVLEEETNKRIVVSDTWKDIPNSLVEAKLDSKEKIVEKLSKVAVENGHSSKDSAFYDVVLQMLESDGNTWKTVTAENFPKEGVTLTIPYPEGTNRFHFDFVVTHMFTVAMNGYNPGDVEILDAEKTDNGLKFTVSSLSPIGISWVALDEEKETPTKPDEKETSGKQEETTEPKSTEVVKPSASGTTPPKTGDSSLFGWLLICGVVSCGLAVIVTNFGKNKKVGK